MFGNFETVCPNISLLDTMEPNKTFHTKTYLYLPYA